MERGSEQQIFAPLPGEGDENVNPRLSEIEGLEPATVAVLEEAGYRTLDDIIDLEREDFLRLAGIAPEEADRLMTIIDELTTEEGSEAQPVDAAGAPVESETSEVAVAGAESSSATPAEATGDAVAAGDGAAQAAPAAKTSPKGKVKSE